MIKFQLKLTLIKSIQELTFIRTDINLVWDRSRTMSQCLARDQSSRALLMKICQTKDFRRASRLIREICQCLSQLIASKSISSSTASLKICRRSTILHTTIDLSDYRNPYSDLHYALNLTLISN